MYSSLGTNPDEAKATSDVIREVAAIDCVRLAQGCLTNAKAHLTQKEAPERASSQDQLLTIKDKVFDEIFNLEDFWKFFISCLEKGQQDFGKNLLQYKHQFFDQQKTFQ
jgi:hypothetical protein